MARGSGRGKRVNRERVQKIIAVARSACKIEDARAARARRLAIGPPMTTPPSLYSLNCSSLSIAMPPRRRKPFGSH